jgi:hypothetical protein
MFTYFYAHILIHVTNICVHICPIQVYTHVLLRPYTYKDLHTNTPIYLYRFTYFYAHISIHVYILRRMNTHTPIHPYVYTYIRIFLCPYTNTDLHISRPINAIYISAIFYVHLAIQLYILLRPYTKAFLHTCMPIYAQYMSTYYEADIRPIYVYILLCPYAPYIRSNTTKPINLYLITLLYIYILLYMFIYC